MNRIILIALLLGAYLSLSAAVSFEGGKSIVKARRWEVVDISFQAKDTKALNPFTEEFSALFKGPGGIELEVPGFFNGDKEWVIRFSGSVPGTWTYETRSRLKALHGKGGSVEVLEETYPGSHGGIVIPEDNPQHFRYEDGTPYFVMAYECDWLYALDYHNEEGVPKTEHFLDLLAGNGCTQVVMNVFTYDVSWPKDPKLEKYPEHEFGGPEDIFPFLGNNEHPDYSALNPVFFKRFDRTVAALNDRNIAAHLMIYVWNKLVAWPEMYSEADNMYFDYVIKRYQAYPNIVWDISKEALTYGRADYDYILERIKRVRKADVFKRPLTVHDWAFCKKHTETVDFFSMQSWSSTIYTFSLDTWKENPHKPIFNIEHGGYEESPYLVWTGDFVDPSTCLKRNYQCIFGGAYSTYYWQGCSWNVLIHNPFEQPDDWPRPRFDYYRHMTDFFTEHPYHEFKPEPGRNGSGYCMSDGKGTYLIYVPKENYQVQANYLRQDADKREFLWFNTLTGEYAPLVGVGQDGEGVVSGWQNDVHLRSPWKGEADAILVSKLK